MVFFITYKNPELKRELVCNIHRAVLCILTTGALSRMMFNRFSSSFQFPVDAFFLVQMGWVLTA